MIKELEKSRPMPMALDIEESILSAILIDRGAIALIIDDLSAEMFYKTSHQEIYSAYVSLYEKCDSIDLETTFDELRRRSMLQKIGGPMVLISIANKTTSTKNIEYHSRIVIEKYLQRKVIHAAYSWMNKAYRDDNDIFDLIGQISSDLIGFTDHIAGGEARHAGDVAKDIVSDIRKSMQDGADKGKIETSLPELDQTLGGLQPGDLAILAARPAMGKTTFAKQIARKAAISQGKAVSLQSLEMTSKQLIGGMICSEAGVPVDRIRDYSKFESSELERFEKTSASFGHHPIYISDTPGVNIQQVRSSAKSAKMRANRDGVELGIVIIDYLQLMTGTTTKQGMNREQEIAGISRGLKSLAKELGVPILALSQLSRAVETRGGDKRPQLSDLRESGAIEQDADMVMFLYRPEYYKILEDEQGNCLKGVTEIIVGKNRHGEAKDVRCKLRHSTGIFEPLEDDFISSIKEEIETSYTGKIQPGTVTLDNDQDIPF